MLWRFGACYCWLYFEEEEWCTSSTSHWFTLLHTFAFVPQSNQSIGGGSNEGNHNFNDTIVGSDGLGSENNLKLKLKFGGVTHTSQTNSTVEYAPQFRQKQVLQDKHSDFSYPLDKEKAMECE